MKRKENLKEIALLFLKLGTIAFGGPSAHIAMMEDEVVKKKKWMSHEHFLDLVGATNLIPGPNSTEMTLHCGYERAGWRGLIVAGISFILPAVLITSIFGWLYYRYGQLSIVEPFLYGIKPAVIAIIFSAVFSLGKKALKNNELGILGGITLVAYAAGINEIAALFGCGVLGILLYFFKENRLLHSIVPFLFLRGNIIGENDFKIFLTFIKIGSVLYGSGYVLFAFLDAELVAKGLLSRQQLIDAIAIGQFTPGPVLSTATFIGWQMNGFLGAILATLGIFLPSFFLVLLLNPLIVTMRKSEVLSAFLDAVNIASVALILAVCIEMGATVLIDWKTIVIGTFSLIIIFIFKKLNSAFIVLGAALTGYLLWLI
jgi:chromate transporter